MTQFVDMMDPTTTPIAGEPPFCLPPNTWGIVIDDSRVQRKLLGRFLRYAGVSVGRCVVLGETDEEVFGFCDRVAKLMMEHGEDRFLLIVDENLDVVDEDNPGMHRTVSGSLLVHDLRERLRESNDEGRMISLVRSANDSAGDLELYKRRAHGYLFKEPVQKNRVLETIKPWWQARFHHQQQSSAAGYGCRRSTRG